jgi:hypothetical protein
MKSNKDKEIVMNADPNKTLIDEPAYKNFLKQPNKLEELEKKFIKECATGSDEESQVLDLNGVRYCMLPVDKVWFWVITHFNPKE